MANIPLQSITFPGLSDKYTTPAVDATLTQTGAAADAKKTGDEITGLKNDLSELESVLEIPYEATGSTNPYGSGSWVNAIENISLTSGKTYLFTLTPATEYEGTINIVVSTPEDGTPASTSLFNGVVGTGYSRTYTPSQNCEKVRVRLYGQQSNVNVVATCKEVTGAENAISRIDSVVNALSDVSAYVETGWSGATQKPQNYYVNAPHINFKVGDTITAKTGYELTLQSNAGETLFPWFSAKTLESNYSDHKIVVRRTSAEAPIDKYIDGLTLKSYCVEPYVSEQNKAVILSDEQIAYIKSALLSVRSAWYGKKAAFVGDSITYGTDASTGNIYYQVIDDMINFSDVYADGVAGSCYSVTSNYGSSIAPITQRYSNIPTDCDLVVIFAGTNDWGHNTPLGTIADTTDISFYGALNVVISGILSANPRARLVLITPLHRWGFGDYQEDTGNNGQGLPLKAYVDAIKASAEMFGVPVLDLFSSACINPRITAIKTAFMPDGLHPNTEGHRLLANRIVPLLETV